MNNKRLSRAISCLNHIARKEYYPGIRHHLRFTGRLHRMIEYQGGKCALCEEQCLTERELAIDHCHKTGKIRGLLCNRCNMALGAFQDNPLLLEKAIYYLTNKSLRDKDRTYLSCV